MVGNKSPLVVLLTLSLLFAVSTALAGEASPLVEKTHQTKVLGKNTGAELSAGTDAVTRALKVRSTLSVFGVVLPALLAITNPANTIDGVTYTEVYSFGKRVFSDNAYFSHDGIAGFRVGLPPIQVRVPALAYPVGPLLLELDAGARFHADLEGQNMSVIGIPAELSSLGIELQARGLAAGFVEGYAKLLFLRAGLGGQLDLVELTAKLFARYNFDGSPPLVMANLLAEFLKGRFYAFVDFFNIFGWGWKRLFDWDLYSWNGYCFSAGNLACPRR